MAGLAMTANRPAAPDGNTLVLASRKRGVQLFRAPRL
jgi:hypothetical protein